MKISTPIIITSILLSSCTLYSNKNGSFEVNLEIPETYVEVDNSSPITVNGTEVSLSGEKIQVGDTLEVTVLDNKADYFDRVST
jgi:hypothetical protein